jgi:hypothetical protein
MPCQGSTDARREQAVPKTFLAQFDRVNGEKERKDRQAHRSLAERPNPTLPALLGEIQAASAQSPYSYP